jgi:hypothetical protein
MSDDATLQALRDELVRQREDEQRRYEDLKAKLAEREAPDPNDPKNWNPPATMRNGYAENAAEAAKKGGDDD